MPQGEWERRAKHMACQLKMCVMKHVHWWDKNAVNPAEDDMYPLPHLIFTHYSGVHTFCVEQNYFLVLASFLDECRNYSDAG